MSSTVAAVPAVTMDFSGKGDAWDDRELVNAYDAALLEFHIHNPGPGSWLDKATAALAKGQPLPGSNAFGTAWYSSSQPTESSMGGGPASAGPSRKKRKAETTANPYAKSSQQSHSQAEEARAESPTYQPASPGNVGDDAEDTQWDEVEWPPELKDNNGQLEEDEDEGAWEGDNGYEVAAGPTNHDPGHVFPPPSGQWEGAGDVTRDEALGYALHAQYWAGYWMGVARGRETAAEHALPRATKRVKPRAAGPGVPSGLRR